MCRWSMLIVLAWGAPALAQDEAANKPLPAADAVERLDPPLVDCIAPERHGRGFIDGNHNFPNFIGYVSNPLFNIDPRSLSALYPLYGQTWISTTERLPHGDILIPGGAALTLALGERLSVGINQGGYVLANFERDTIVGERGRQREGWLNLGGFVQYTVYQDVPGQCLATAGLHWTAPSGTKDVFQGLGPARLAPYVTLGKEWGEFHLLTTVGYNFPAGSSDADLKFFYGVVHLDRRFGWLYPLVEFNWVAHTTTVDPGAFREGGFIDFGTFSATGDIVALAVGANAVLVPSRFEIGAVYTTPLHTERRFDFDGIWVKMVYRF